MKASKHQYVLSRHHPSFEKHQTKYHIIPKNRSTIRWSASSDKNYPTRVSAKTVPFRSAVPSSGTQQEQSSRILAASKAEIRRTEARKHIIRSPRPLGKHPKHQSLPSLSSQIPTHHALRSHLPLSKAIPSYYHTIQSNSPQVPSKVNPSPHHR